MAELVQLELEQSVSPHQCCRVSVSGLRMERRMEYRLLTGLEIEVKMAASTATMEYQFLVSGPLMEPGFQ